MVKKLVEGTVIEVNYRESRPCIYTIICIHTRRSLTRSYRIDMMYTLDYHFAVVFGFEFR